LNSRCRLDVQTSRSNEQLQEVFNTANVLRNQAYNLECDWCEGHKGGQEGQGWIRYHAAA
jgi:hypothetical protein